MGIYDILNLAAGLCLFLYGMQRSEKALKLLAGSRIRRLIERATRNRFLALIIGLLVTLATQSSSATTVILVGFTTAGLISLQHTIGIILGAAVGTTLTIQMFAWRITQSAPLLIAGGYALMLISRERDSRDHWGRLLLGLGLVFLGMNMMADSVGTLRESEILRSILSSTRSPVAFLLIGTLFTAVIQSSAATIAIVIALSQTGGGMEAALTLEHSIALTLGANIGTTATALIASASASAEGRRVAWAHTIFKLVSACIALVFVKQLSQFGQWSSPDSIARQIANVDTLYNVCAAILFLPLTGLIALSARAVVPSQDTENYRFKVQFINREFGAIPTLALSQARKEIVRMSDLVAGMLEQCWSALGGRDAKPARQAIADDDGVDFLQERVTPYLIDIGRSELPQEESRIQSQLLAVASEVELIGDIISKELCPSVVKYIDSDSVFSPEGIDDLNSFYERIRLELYAAFDVLARDDYSGAYALTSHKAELEAMHESLREKHFARLRKHRSESLETTTRHLDILEDLRRIASHALRVCSVVAHREEKAA